MPEVGDDGYLYQGLSSILFPVLLGKPQPKSIQNERISVLDYLQEIGLGDWPDERFCMFIERIVHPEVQQPDTQIQLVAQFNSLLQQDLFELRQEDSQGGLPVYKVRRKEIGVDGQPKYIIFASKGPKPDIIINDAVNMVIRVVRFGDQCLVYDEPPPHGDLTWQMLVVWWGKKILADPRDDNTRRDIGLRLRSSLQSEPEVMLYDTYFKMFKPIFGMSLPALLPQVYLHYDPRNQNERREPVLVRQRMDFLMLLRNSTRIVIEIDGKQHYADDDDHPSPIKYAEMVAEDRRIRLLGYEVYRFGGAEFISTIRAPETVTTFFKELFERHGIKPSG
jgi:very-short-patch-repair endonuclease